MERASRSLRAARSLHSSERRYVADALHDVVRGLRRLRALSGEKRPTAAQLVAAWLLDEEAAGRPVAGAVRGEQAGHPPSPLLAAQRCGLDLQALLFRRERLAEQLDRVAELEPARQAEVMGESLSYPSWLVRALCDDLGLERTLGLLQAQNRRAPLTVRANALRCQREELAARLLAEGLVGRPTASSPHGLILDGHANVYSSAAFADGWLEIQDEGSQLIAELCAPPPGSTLVDVCAGAGGKSLALGARLENRGRIVAMDIDAGKLEELRRRCRRAGLSNVGTTLLAEDWATGGGLGEVPAWLRQHGADRVLVDAPCSGLGVLRRHPEARWSLQPVAVEQIVGKQRAILQAASALVRPRGRLIYATCTVLRRENDDIVDSFLRQNPDFSAVPAEEILGRAAAAAIGDGQRLRLLPTAGGCDGFFAAVLCRVG